MKKKKESGWPGLPMPNRNYRDTVFRMLFREKKELLSLFNAIHGTSYDDPEELEITTLENAVYLAMKNDISCVLGMHLDLYEHQSTVNPNMPLAEAVETAVDLCIKEGILSDFLRKNKSEVIPMSIFEYDEEKHLRTVREEGYEDGVEKKEYQFICNMLRNNLTPELISKCAECPLEYVYQVEQQMLSEVRETSEYGEEQE